MRQSTRGPALLVAGSAAVGAAAAYAVLVRAAGGIATAVEIGLLSAVGAGAFGACILRSRRALSGHAPAWLNLASALALTLVARWTWVWHPSAATLRWPSLAPTVQVLAAILAGLAVLGLRAPQPDRRSARRGALDAAAIVAAVAITTGNAVFSTAEHTVAGTTAMRICAGAVATADGWLAVCALLTLSRARHPGGANLRTLLPVSAGLVALAAGNAGLVSGSLAGSGSFAPATDLFTIVGLALLVAGALSPDSADEAASMPRRERIAISAAVGPVVLAALAVAAFQVSEHRLPTAAALAVVALTSLLLARLIVALLDMLVLSRTLETQVQQRTLELITQEHWFRSLVQHSSDVVTVVDATGIIRYQSPAMQRLFGHDPAETSGTVLARIVRSQDVAQLHAVLAEAVAAPGTSYMLELGVQHRDGTWRATETVVTSLLDVPDIRGVVLNIRDITDRKQLQERLTHQAYHDALTGLANRSLFHHELGVALSASPPGAVAVLFCDLDGFKAVNDSQGHDVGDVLLRIVADRLRSCVRPHDLVARFGGDEFAVLVREGRAVDAARCVADRIAADLSTPFAFDGRELRVGVSIGLAVAEKGTESVEVLLRNADLAMYRAKGDRHVAVATFEPAMHDALLMRLQVEDDLRIALDNAELVLHYQPTVELASGLPTGVEALMRWYRPDRGIVSPADFIPIAEDNGFIDAMGRWALFEACRVGATWQRFARPGGVFSVGVNISARQVTPALVDVVAAALSEAGLTPEILLLEMTESVLLERTDEAIAVLRALKQIGVRIAIDDFGTGFSSLSYLSRFPVDVLKIDKHFIDEVDRNSERTEVARTIVRLGHSLGLATIAEGIERPPQRHALRQMGCLLGQGYLFGRPLPARGVTDLLEATFSAPIPAQRAVGFARA